jgi:hypothetical protein
MSSQVVMFFSPFAGVWQHAMPEALVAAALKHQGAKVIYAVCNGLYSEGCYAMSAHGLSGDSDVLARERVCVICRKQRDIIVKQLNVESIVIDDFIDKDSEGKVKSILNEVTIENIERFEYEGFSLARYAIHETILHFKLTSLSEMTIESLRDYKLKLKHVLLTYFIGKKLLERLSPDRVVIYNTHPSTNYTIMQLAEKREIPTYGLHAGGNMADRLSTLYVFRRDMVVLYRDWINRFLREWGSLPTVEQGLRNATQHFLALSVSKTVWVYSAPKSSVHKDVRTYFGIKKEQKVLLATLSSYDEMYSGQMMGMMGVYPLIFPTQVEWIRQVISYVKQKQDLFLIIRVHPRELPNRRDNVHSMHAKMLADELQDLPSNVCINWPSDGVSLYDLIPIVDVGLNGWSSAGKELSMLGVPVVIYTSEILFYPHSLNILAKDRINYFECIERALSEGWSFDRIRQVYRWLAVEYTLGTFSIKDRFKQSAGKATFLQRVISRVKRPFALKLQARNLGYPLIEGYKFAQVILNGEEVVDVELAYYERLSTDDELRLIREEVGEILRVVYPNVPIGYSKIIDNLRLAITNTKLIEGYVTK